MLQPAGVAGEGEGCLQAARARSAEAEAEAGTVPYIAVAVMVLCAGGELIAGIGAQVAKVGMVGTLEVGGGWGRALCDAGAAPMAGESDAAPMDGESDAAPMGGG